METRMLGQIEPAAGDVRKLWEDPRIVLERSLEVAAQGGAPGGAVGGPPQGFLGPLGTSGGSGTCL